MSKDGTQFDLTSDEKSPEEVINKEAPGVNHPQWLQATSELLQEINSYEYFQQNRLQLKIFKKVEKISLLEIKTETCIQLYKDEEGKKRILYVRIFDGYSEELRYQAVFFFYRDVFNGGLELMHKISLEQEKLDKEKKIIEKASDEKETNKSGLILPFEKTKNPYHQ